MGGMETVLVVFIQADVVVLVIWPGGMQSTLTCLGQARNNYLRLDQSLTQRQSTNIYNHRSSLGTKE